MPQEPKSGTTPVKGQEDRQGDPGLKSSGLPPAAVPDLVPAAGRVRTVGQPIVQDGHLIDGELPVVAQPLVLANGGREMDPRNPAGVPYRETPWSKDAVKKGHQKELLGLLNKDPADLTAADHERKYQLHYLVNGQEVPAG